MLPYCDLGWFHMTFLAMVSCPLSRWERVRVRVFIRAPWGPSPPALSRWEREQRRLTALPRHLFPPCTRFRLKRREPGRWPVPTRRRPSGMDLLNALPRD